MQFVAKAGGCPRTAWRKAGMCGRPERSCAVFVVAFSFWFFFFWECKRKMNGHVVQFQLKYRRCERSSNMNLHFIINTRIPRPLSPSWPGGPRHLNGTGLFLTRTSWLGPRKNQVPYEATERRMQVTIIKETVTSKEY